MRQKLQLLQISRGFAALLVILFHLQDTSITYFKVTAFNDFFSFGNLGVDYFFVLSGFIITYVHYSDLVNGTNPFTFLKKRFIRIYPTYWAIASITLIMLIFALHGKSPHLDHDINLKSFSEWLYLLGCYLLLPMKSLYFLQLAWTLSYEMIFYLIFFTGIILGFKKAKILLGIWLFLIIVQIPFKGFHGVFFDRLLNGINLEFMAGCLVAYLIKNSLRIPKWVSYFLLISIPLIFYFKMYVYNIGTERDFFNLILLVLFNGFLLYNIVAIDIYKEIKSPQLLLLVGEATYSIYLSHTFFLGVLGRAFSKCITLLHITNGFLIQSILIIIFLLSVLGGIICFKYLETPLIRFSNRIFKSKKTSVT